MKRTKLFEKIKAETTEKLLEKINTLNKKLETMDCECFVQELHLQYAEKFAIINFKIPEEKEEQIKQTIENL